MANFAELVLRARTEGLRQGERALRDTTREARRTERATDDMSRGFDRAGRSSGGMSANMKKAAIAVAAVSAAIAGLGTAIRVIREFETSMSRLGAVSRATATELNNMRNVARNLGATTEFSATQAADGLNFLAMAGFSASESMAAIPAVLDLATASGLGLADAADIASNIMSGFGIEAKNAADVADILAAASSRANTDVSQLGQAMATVAPIAKALDMRLEDTAAAIGVLSDAGIQGERAGTALRGVLASLAGPTADASKVFNNLGLTIADIDPAVNSLSVIMQRLGDAGLSTADAMTVFGREAASGALVLIDGAKRVGEFGDELSRVDGAASDMADTMRDNLGGDIDGLQSAVAGLIISLGDAGLTAVLRGVISVVTTVVRVVGYFVDIIGGLGGAVASVTKELMGFGVSALNTQRAIDNITLAIGDEVKALGVLSGELIPGTRLSYDAAEAKLAETRAIYSKIEAARQEALQETMRSEAYRESQREIDRLQQALERIVRFQQDAADDPDSLLAQMPEQAQRAAEQVAGIQDALIAAVEKQNALVAASSALSPEIVAAQNAIDLLEAGIAESAGEMVIVGGKTAEATTLTERLAMIAGQVSFERAATDAENLAKWLGISVSAALQLTNITPMMADEDAAMGVSVMPTGQQREANRRAVESYRSEVEKLTGSTSRAGGASRAARDEFEALRRSLDPDYANLVKYNEATKLLNAALAEGKVTQAEYNKLLAAAKDQFGQAEKSVKSLSSKLRGELKSAVGDVKDAWSDFVDRGFKDFKGFANSVVDIFKQMLLKMIAMAAKNKIMVSLGLGGGGGLASAGASLLGGAGGILGGVGGLAGLGSAFLGGASFLGSGIASGFAAGGIGGAISGGASALATAASGATLGLGGAAAALGAVAGPALALYAAVKFFGKTTKTLDTGIRVAVDGMDVLAESFKKTQTSRFFGLSKKNRTTTTAAPGIAGAVADIQGSVVEAARVLGVGSSVFDQFSYDFKLSLKGLSADERTRKVNEELQKLGDNFAMLVPGMQSANEVIAKAAEISARVRALTDTSGLFATRAEAIFAAASTGQKSPEVESVELLREVVRAIREGDINNARLTAQLVAIETRRELEPTA
jgi:TP901 family phage tail tape measure protein